MTCYHPLEAYKSLSSRTAAGRCSIVFQRPAGPYENITLACGQCIGCRLTKSKEWSLRCMHEASLHDLNCFITLTYDDKHLPSSGSLIKSHHQKFMKRLRKRFREQKIRYFLCGEYGEKSQRPHYHAILFGFDFEDKIEWSTAHGGNKLYRSPGLEDIWSYGYSTIGKVTQQSAAYVARYVLKKVNGDHAHEKYVVDVDPETGECEYLEPEYIAMSNRPGIGRTWYEMYKNDCQKDFLTWDGKEFKIPRYYDSILEEEDIYAYHRIKRRRKEKALEKTYTPTRLRQMELHKTATVKALQRNL